MTKQSSPNLNKNAKTGHMNHNYSGVKLTSCKAARCNTIIWRPSVGMETAVMSCLREVHYRTTYKHIKTMSTRCLQELWYCNNEKNQQKSDETHHFTVFSTPLACLNRLLGFMLLYNHSAQVQNVIFKFSWLTVMEPLIMLAMGI